MDLMAIYLSPVVGVGPRLRAETIDKRLAQLPLIPVLLLLAQINFRADVVDSVQDRIAFAQYLLPSAIARRAIELMRSDAQYHVVGSQVVTRFAFRALVNCDARSGGAVPTNLPQRLGELLLSYAGIVEEESDATEEISLEIVRLELWYRLRDYDRWYEVAHRIIFEILPSLRGHADWIDSRQILEDAAGMTLDLFWALTTTFGVAVANDRNSFRFPKYTDTDHVDNADIDRWDRFWSTSLDEARMAAQADLANGLWLFNTFYNKPLLDLGNGTSIVIRPWFLANKATPTGFYATVEQLMGNDREMTGKWGRLFGQAVDKLGRTLIAEHCPGVQLLADETAIRSAWGDGMACDSVILGDDWLAIDFVHRRISRETGTTGDLTYLAKDLQIGVVDKLIQIDATLARGVETSGAPQGKMYPLVVIGSQFPINGLVLNEIDRMLDVKQPKVIGVDRVKCAPPLVVDVGEFWMLLEVAQNKGVTPASLIEDWLSSPLGLVSFRNWLVTNGPGQPPVPTGTRRRYANHAALHLFGREA